MQTALLLLLPAFLLAITLLSINRRSRRQGKWTPEQTHAPHIEWLSDERQTIHFIRNNTYRSATDFDVHYLTKTLNVADLESLFYIVEPFSPWPGTAHTFLSFRFKSGETYAISVEARRKVSESFSLLRGFMRAFQLIYVIGTEKDVVGLRVTHRKHVVCRYPVNIERDKIQQLWTSMLRRAQKLNQEPEFYHTFFNNCIMNIIRHLNKQLNTNITSSWPIVLPGFSDRYAYRRGWLATSLSFKEARNVFTLSSENMENG